jgi:signal transduction histidine kinase
MTSSLLRPAALVPPNEWPHLARRGLHVCLGAAVLTVAIALLQAGGARPRYEVAAAYAFGISLMTWVLIDIGRIVLRGVLDAPAPGYWPRSRGKAIALVVPGVALGYIGGTALGDWVAGRSTLALLTLNPARFYGVLIGSVAVSVASIAYFVHRGRSETMARLAQQARLDALVSQLEPHMLFNTLANLRVLIGRDPAEAQAMLDRLVSYLRSTLAGARAATHSLADEFARIADYLALMGARMGPRLDVKLDLPEALRDCAVPALLLQPLVENAIVHGLEPAVRGGRIAVTARRSGEAAGDMLMLEVRDTGVGLAADAARAPAATAAAQPGAAGYGLAHVRERLAVLYGAQASLQLAAASDAEGGTVARVSLPAQPAGAR